MTDTLFILNGPPYGSELSYNGLRLARSLARKEGEKVRVFLMGDAVACAKGGQKVPQGYYNIADMLTQAHRAGAEIGVCGTCIDARGIAETELTEGALRGTMDELTDWTQRADKVIVF
ncbi:MAG: hypothetical protein FJX47_13705 [Alphaproteobacteria bacterium]|nr:hypothetical protein [Alphaproteobacteria bacterium]